LKIQVVRTLTDP